MGGGSNRIGCMVKYPGRNAFVRDQVPIRSRKLAKKSSDDQPAQTFESALQDLESTIRAMEQGQLGLDGTLQAYEKAIGQLRFCNQQLSDAERKIEILQGVEKDGSPITQPFEEGAEDLAQKQAQRSRRRSAD